MSERPRNVVALAGGVGGAKLAHGLALTGLGAELQVVVNTADDFRLYGLHISPDIDTVMYTLGGVANSETGWGIAGDTYASLEMMRRYGEDTWFLLGDRDLATHILRTEALRAGRQMTDIVADLAGGLGIEAAILPMADEPVETLVETPDGLLEFQEYFVRRRHADDVTGVRFRGIEEAAVTAEVGAALDGADTVILCPSNPIVSIGPILELTGFRARLAGLKAPVVAVSPIIGGQALKGPAAGMLATLGHEVSAYGVAVMYQDFLDGIVIDEEDRELAGRLETLGIAVEVTNTIMRSDDDREALAESTLGFAASLTGDAT